MDSGARTLGVNGPEGGDSMVWDAGVSQEQYLFYIYQQYVGLDGITLF